MGEINQLLKIVLRFAFLLLSAVLYLFVFYPLAIVLGFFVSLYFSVYIDFRGWFFKIKMKKILMFPLDVLKVFKDELQGLVKRE